MDEELWTSRVEKVALVSFTIAMFHCFSVSAFYNVSVLLFALYSAYTRNGRINVVALYAVVLSLFIDIVYMSLYAQINIDLKYQYSWGIAMLIINLFVKVILAVCQYFLFIEYGGMYGLNYPTGAYSTSSTDKSYSVEPFQSSSSHVTYPVSTGTNNNTAGYQNVDV